jgi:uracil-DNA glycosylase
MIIGQAPGVTEADVGRPFNASSGRRLFEWLAEVGWQEDVFRATQYMTAVTKCFPGKAAGGKGDRVPTRAEQKLCASFLEQEIALVQPVVLLPVGGLAVSKFLGRVKLTEAVGTVHQFDGRWVVPLPHPSGASLWLNRPQNRQRVQQALDHLRQLRIRLDV